MERGGNLSPAIVPMCHGLVGKPGDRFNELEGLSHAPR